MIYISDDTSKTIIITNQLYPPIHLLHTPLIHLLHLSISYTQCTNVSASAI